MRIRLPLLLIALGLLSVCAWGGPITITNPNFSSPTVTVSNNNQPPTGWTGGGNLVDGVMVAKAPLSDLDGDGQYLYINSGTVTQTLAVSLLPNEIYTLTVEVGLRGDANCLAIPCVATPNVELLAGANVLGTASGTLPTAGNWSLYTLNYTTGSSPLSGSLEISLGSSGPQTNFDEVALSDTATPEPATFTLLGFGLVGAGFVARRRKRSNIN